MKYPPAPSPTVRRDWLRTHTHSIRDVPLGWAGIVPHRALKSGRIRMKNSQTRIFSLIIGNLVICSLSQLNGGDVHITFFWGWAKNQHACQRLSDELISLWLPHCWPRAPLELVLSLQQTRALTKIVLSCPVSCPGPCLYQVSPESLLQKATQAEARRCDARNSTQHITY